MAAYCTPEDLRRVLGAAAVDDDTEAVEDACDAASRLVDEILGAPIVDPVDVRIKRATMKAAVRIYRDPESPYGVVGTGGDEIPTYPKGLKTSTEDLLFGLRSSFGLA